MDSDDLHCTELGRALARVRGLELLRRAQGPDVSGLSMIALYPKPAEQEAIAVEGGQPAESLHVTLLFLGELVDVDVDLVLGVLQDVAAAQPPLAGVAGGAGFFSVPGDYPLILLPDVKGLAAFRTGLEEELAEAGVASPSEHGFLPHVTVAYQEQDEEPELNGLMVKLGAALTFETISFVAADERTDFQLGG